MSSDRGIGGKVMSYAAHVGQVSLADRGDVVEADRVVAAHWGGVREGAVNKLQWWTYIHTSVGVVEAGMLQHSCALQERVFKTCHPR